MDFRLTYEGTLPPAGSGSGTGRTKEKHMLRKHFHKQMHELWQQHPELRTQATSKYIVYFTAPNLVSSPGPNVKQIVRISDEESLRAGNVKTWVEHIANDHQKFGGRFVPLVSKEGGFTCTLDILFLRRDNPGNIVKHGGDIDNRLKVLLDGLRMPDSLEELGGYSIEPDEDPFYCLLEDDRLITSVSVTADRLLAPPKDQESIHDVYLIIKATIVDQSALFVGGRLV